MKTKQTSSKDKSKGVKKMPTKLATKRKIAPKRDNPTSLRLPEALAQRIEEAVALTGISKTSLIRTGLEKHVEYVIESVLNQNRDREIFVLNKENFKRFSDALDNPSPPTNELKELMSRAPWTEH